MFSEGFEKTANTACDRAKIRAIGNSREVLKGGKADGVPDQAFNKKNLKKGMKHESEHTVSKSIQKEIAKDHLAEDPDYYQKLDQIEKSAAFATGWINALRGKKVEPAVDKLLGAKARPFDPEARLKLREIIRNAAKADAKKH